MNVRRFWILLLLGALLMAAPSGYGFYKEETLQSPAGDLTDAVVLIKVIADTDIGGHIEDTTNGYDIRLYDVDNDAEFSFGRLYFDEDTGAVTAEFYVRFPFIWSSPTGDENKYRIYYGKAADSDGQDKATTWQDYTFVHHCADASGTITDATGSHDSSNESIANYQQAGAVRYAIDLNDATPDGFTIADHADLDQDVFTFQMFAYADLWAGGDYLAHRFESSPWNGFNLAMGGTGGANGYFDFNVYQDGVLEDARTLGGDAEDAGQWYLIHGTVDSNGFVEVWEDATVGTNTGDFSGGITISNNKNLGIGWSDVESNGFNGKLEEVRFRPSVLSDNHIAFEYANMVTAPDHFDDDVAEEVVGGGAYSITCDAGSYVLTGTAAGAFYGRAIDADTGSYVLTGQAAGVLYGRKLSADGGAYVLTGQDVALLYGRLISIDAGSYVLTGQDAALRKGRTLTADPGAYVLTGTGAGVLHNKILAASTGSYITRGHTLLFVPPFLEHWTFLYYGRKVSAEAGSYVLYGGPPSGVHPDISWTHLLRGYLIDIEAGAYAIAGQDVTLTFSGGVLYAVIFDVVPRERIVDLTPRRRIVDLQPRARIIDYKGSN